MALCCGSGLLVSHFLPPVYQAHASVEWQSLPPVIAFPVPSAPASSPSPTADTELQTTAEELGSRALVGQVAQRIGPALEVHFWPWWHSTHAAAPVSATRLTQAVRRQLRVIPVAQSRVIKLQFEAPQAALAATFLNQLAAAYVARARERQRLYGLQRVQVLASRAASTRKAIVTAQAQVSAFALARGLADPGSAMKLATSQRQQLASAATAARIQITQQADTLAQNVDASPAAPVEIATERAKLAAEVARLQTIYQPQAAPLQQARQQLAGLDQSLAGWHRQARADAQRNLDAERRQAHDLAVALAEQASDQRSLANDLAHFDLERRGLEAQQAAYSSLLDQLQQAAAETGAGPAPLRIDDPAVAPPRPIRPDPVTTIVYSTLLGLLLGCGTLFLAERWNDGAVLPEAGELGAALLAVLPFDAELNRYAPAPTAPLALAARLFLPWTLPRVARRAGFDIRQGPPADAHDSSKLPPTAERRRWQRPEAAPCLPASRFLFSPAVEHSLEPLAASLIAAHAEAGAQVIFLAGAEASTGASTIARHLACQLASSASSPTPHVLCIEAGLDRNPNGSSDLGTPGPGLRALLAGQASVDEVLRRWEPDTSRPAMGWIPVGAAQAGTRYTLYLAAGAGQELLRAARQRYDWILIDGGVVSAGPESALWASLSDCNLVVAAYRQSSLRQLRRSLDKLEAANAARLGLILNRSPRPAPEFETLWAPPPPQPQADSLAWRQRA